MKYEDIEHPRRLIMHVVDSLERYGKYDFRSDGYIRISKWNKRRALEAYRATLNGMKGQVECEPPSSTMIEEATIEWSLEPGTIGASVRQRHIGTVRESVIPMVDDWIKAGAPYPSSGGLYYTVPTKSFQRVKDLMDVPELRDAVRNLGIFDEWFKYWDAYLPLRYAVSKQLLDMVKNRVDVDALSRDNAEAGTGLYIRGMRPKRKDLHLVAKDLDFLLTYSFSMGVAFAAVQVAALSPDQVYIVEVYDTRIRGAIASRSAIDVVGVDWRDGKLTLECTSATRQAGSDATGLLANSKTEKRLLGSSVTEKVVRETRRRGVEYPFTAKRLLLEIWASDAKPLNKAYVIGQDFGLSEPIKSPADALFSRGFIAIGKKVLPMMLSGSGWTQSVYSPFHNHWITKAAADDQMLCLGDDINLLTHSSEMDMFAPYTKVKSTNPVDNTKKVLGLYTAFSPIEDLEAKAPALIGIVPRVLKTVSSAHKKGSDWSELLSDLDSKGTMTIRHSPRVEESIQADLKELLRYMHWRGPRGELPRYLSDLWANIQPDEWAILTRHMTELEYRLLPEEEVDFKDE